MVNQNVNVAFSASTAEFDSAIARLIKGTENWHNVTLRIIQDMEIKFAQFFANKLLQESLSNTLGLANAADIASQQIAVNDTKNAALLSSDQNASRASLGQLASKAIAAIANDAKQVFSGIFAFLSPVMGPAAAGPAAAGSASVAALASGITYAESGAWNIPDNTLAYLHAGEMVVPKSFASHLRDGQGFSSGDSYTININAIDTQSGAQFLKNNASHIATLIASQVRNFNSNVPAWKS